MTIPYVHVYNANHSHLDSIFYLMTSIASKAPRPAAGLRYRAGVLSRTAAAIGGSYLLAWLSTRALALALPLSPVDSVVAATLSGLAIFPFAVMWTFAAASAVRAWLGLGVACGLAGLALWALAGYGGAA